MHSLSNQIADVSIIYIYIFHKVLTMVVLYVYIALSNDNRFLWLQTLHGGCLLHWQGYSYGLAFVWFAINSKPGLAICHRVGLALLC